MNKKLIISIIVIIIIAISLYSCFLNKSNNKIPNNYIAYVSFPNGEGTRTYYLYAEYDYEETPIKILVAKYSYIKTATSDYRNPKDIYISKQVNFKDIDEVVSLFGNVILNINAKTINTSDDSIKKEYKKGDFVYKEEFREILQNQEWIRTLN